MKKFLQTLLGSTTGYLKLAAGCKGTSVWHQKTLRYPNELAGIVVQMEEWLGEGLDVYFSPHLFETPDPKKKLALPSHILCADLDDCQPERLGKYGEPRPSMVVRTSSTHHQAYWLLDRELKPDELERLNRRLTYAYAEYGCDRSGWDIGQLLRLPGTKNFKREAPEDVVLISAEKTPVSPDKFNCLPEIKQKETAAVEANPGEPPIKLRPDELDRWSEETEDRSAKIFWMVKTLQKRGMTGTGIITYMCSHPLVTEKYAGRERQEIERILAGGEEDAEKEAERKVTETTFIILSDGTICEEVVDLETKEARFATWRSGQVTYEEKVTDGEETYRPIWDDIVSTGLVLFPTKAEEYSSTAGLLGEVQAFIHGWVDLTPRFEWLVTRYVLLTWVYDAFTVLPYMRLMGTPGTGKSRGLKVIGAVCYKRMEVAGASSVAAIFRIMDRYSGTMTIDEGDISKSDEYADFVKILNCGYEAGTPVVKAVALASGDFGLRAFKVYGPKIISTRKRFQDPALESRCLTEHMAHLYRRGEIPTNLTQDFWDGALALRNRLLAFRFRNLRRIEAAKAYAIPGVEPRVFQVISPLLQLAENDGEREELMRFAREYTETVVGDRGLTLAGETAETVLGIIDEAPDTEEIALKEITNRINEGREDRERVSPRKIGPVVRELGLAVKRLNTGRVVDVGASAKALELMRR